MFVDCHKLQDHLDVDVDELRFFQKLVTRDQIVAVVITGSQTVKVVKNRRDVRSDSQQT